MTKPPGFDAELVRFAARAKLVTPELAMTCFGMKRANAYRRLSTLTSAGLLTEVVRSPFGRLHYATPAGIAFSGFDFAAPRFSFATFEHDYAIAQTCALIEARRVTCLTERELRAHERATADGRYVFTAEPNGTRFTRFLPDLALESPEGNGWIAIEIDLSYKTAARRRAILTAYLLELGQADFAGVLYIAGARSRRRCLTRLADEIGLGDGFAITTLNDEAPVRALQSLIDAHLARTV